MALRLQAKALAGRGHGKRTPALLLLLGALVILCGARWWAAQDLLCAQTDQISDACGSFGIGLRPTREERLAWAEERLAWARVSPGDCCDLKLFRRHYPSGVLAGQAQDAMVAPRVHWVHTTTYAWGRAGEGPTFSSERQARADAEQRAEQQNEGECNAPPGARGRGAGLAVSDNFAQPRMSPMKCRSVPGGFVCAYDWSGDCGYFVSEIMPNCGAPPPDIDDEE